MRLKQRIVLIYLIRLNQYFKGNKNMKRYTVFFRCFISPLLIAVSLLSLAACGPKPDLKCLKEKCSGEVTLATLDYSTAKCEAKGQACEFQMPANHKFKPRPVSADGCVKPARCGKGDSCSTALADPIKRAKWDLENERKVLLAGSNNRCVVAPSPNVHVCTWTDPAPLPKPKYVPDKPEAVCTKNKCKCP